MQVTSLLKQYWILIVLIIIKFTLQFLLVNGSYELHRDEFLHLDQAFHPAAGYISVPPFTSWMAGFIYLMGGGLFWIRFVPAFFGAATVFFSWKIVEELGGRLPSKILTSILLIFSVYARLNVLFQPNSFDILCWTMVFYFLIKYFKNNEVKWLYLLAVIIVLGLYNKYTIIFLIVGLAAGIFITDQRYLYFRKPFYIALALSIILFSPNIIWQIANHFPFLHHMRALNESQLVYVNRFDFWMDQLKFGVIGIPVLGAFWALIVYKPFKSYRFVFWTFVIVMGLFTLARAKSYYSLGLYPVLFAIGSVYLEFVLKKWTKVVFSVLVILHVGAFFIIVKYLMPFQNPSEIIANNKSYERIGLLRWEDGINHALPQDFADMLGWKEMAEKALIAYNRVPKKELNNTLIYCENYGQAGAINYYNRNKTHGAYSFSSDYIYWLPDALTIKNVVYVGNTPDQNVLDMFENYKEIGVVENEFSRENGTKILLLIGAKQSASDMFYKIVANKKSNFDIF